MDASDEKTRLTIATRRLIHEVFHAGDSTDDTSDIAVVIEGVVEDLEKLRANNAANNGTTTTPLNSRSAHNRYLPRSPVSGPLNPIAPPMTVEIREDGRAIGKVRFDAAYEGPPGYVHGALVAAIFDELLGLANIANRTPGMTAQLKVRYRRPTPLHTELLVEAWVDNVDGRRITTSAALFDGDLLLAEAEGTFITLDSEQRTSYFGFK